MPNYGFVIDNRKCIGCHACSTACKSENEVPLSVYRTWVKYVETGAYPDVRRHFQVTRCNHCANPPCVRICPVTAMYQRNDGIVEFDPDICIGCKACMQACPYDAIYIDPNTNTAAKCHYCSHRTEIGLEPACVVVCPEHAIIAGDMDDPASEISHILATTDVTVRKPEQGTAPKLFYIDGNDWALHPTAVERAPASFMWSDVIPLHDIPVMGETHIGQDISVSQEIPVARNDAISHAPAPAIHTAPSNGKSNQAFGGNGSNGHGGMKELAKIRTTRRSKSGVPLRTPQPQGTPWNGPIQLGGRVAEHMVQVAYNAQHKVPWHWPVPAYLVSKAIGAGLFMLLSLGLGLGWVGFEQPAFLASGFAALLFIGITTGLLVYDLERPERFFSILLRPQWKSWLARGAYILVSFTLIAGVWWLLEAGAAIGWLPDDLVATIRPFALWTGLPLAAGAAVYTAFLFGQAEGRDLWQSGLLPVHLLLQSFLAGSAALLVLDLFSAISPALTRLAAVTFGVSLLLDLGITLFGEFGMPHASEVAARAAHDISHGRYKNHFWWGSIVLGHAIPLIMLLVAGLVLPSLPLAAAIISAAAAVCAIAGLYLFEFAFVMAPQDIPNS